jgi:sterol desaturase/sphingolipid hydroxylase (fatty acid hydroxylase superfamily)
MFNLAATLFIGGFVLILLIFSFVYLTKSQFMPYHGIALDKDWRDLNPSLQTLIIGFMRAVGGGLLAGAVTILFLQYQFNKMPQQWIALAILTCGSIVKTKTKGKPPIIVTIVAFVLLIVGYFLNISNLK